MNASEADLGNLADDNYYWHVKVVDNFGNESSWSATDNFTVDVTAPSVPSNLADNVSANNVLLDWSDSTDNVTGLDKYIVEYATNPEFTGANSLEAVNSQWTLSDLADGTYYWRVEAVDNNDNESAWSVTDSFTVDITAPSVPDGLISDVDGTELTLDWDDATDNLTGVAGYDVEYSTDPSYATRQHKYVESSEIYITGLAYDKYYWKVRTIDNNGNKSSWSSRESFIYPEDSIGNTFNSAKNIDVIEEYTNNDFVGKADACDMYCFEPEKAGEFDFVLSGLDAKAKIYLYEYDSGKDKNKKIKSANAKGSTATINDILLDVGTYYFEVVSGDKGKGKFNTDYTLEITPDYFPDATDNNSWQDATEIVPDVQLDGFVGFGDACDCYKFEVDDLTAFDFDLTGEDKNAKLTLYRWDDNKNKLNKVANTSLKYGEASIDNLNLDAGLYYVEVLSADKGKGKKNTEYELDITAV